jgi:chromosome segregation ATPase
MCVFLSIIACLGTLSAVCGVGPQLPSPWTAHVHNGKTYFHNPQTGQSSWTPPTLQTAEVHSPEKTAADRVEQSISEERMIALQHELDQYQRDIGDMDTTISELQSENARMQAQLLLHDEVVIAANVSSSTSASAEAVLQTRVAELTSELAEALEDCAALRRRRDGLEEELAVFRDLARSSQEYLDLVRHNATSLKQVYSCLSATISLSG